MNINPFYKLAETIEGMASGLQGQGGDHAEQLRKEMLINVGIPANTDGWYSADQVRELVEAAFTLGRIHTLQAEHITFDFQ